MATARLSPVNVRGMLLDAIARGPMKCRICEHIYIRGEHIKLLPPPKLDPETEARFPTRRLRKQLEYTLDGGLIWLPCITVFYCVRCGVLSRLNFTRVPKDHCLTLGVCSRRSDVCPCTCEKCVTARAALQPRQCPKCFRLIGKFRKDGSIVRHQCPHGHMCCARVSSWKTGVLRWSTVSRCPQCAKERAERSEQD